MSSDGLSNPNVNCTQATCDDSQSVYGYRPSLAATVIFLMIFIISGIVHQWQGIKTRTWFFSTAMVLGCVSEMLGYIAKVLLYQDPFSDTGFKISVILLTFAPAFYSAALYYTLKQVSSTFGTKYSRIPPRYYTWIFIMADVLAILLQAIGGGIAGGADNDATLQQGDRVMIAGLASQVITLVAFGLFAGDYAWTMYQRREKLDSATATLRSTRQFKLFLGAAVVAYIAILVRCIYRIAELAKGWSPDNDILRQQGLFIGLESFPCALATVVLNIWHPGWCFAKIDPQVEVHFSSEELQGKA